MKGRASLVICLLGLLHASYGQIDYDSCIIKLTKAQLITEIARYSEQWKNDSLAKNGFRKFFGKEFLWCSGDQLKGMKWNELRTYLGRPHFFYDSKKYSYLQKGQVNYRYVLFAYRSYRQFKDLGNIILDITVLNGMVERVALQEVDG